MGTFVGLDVSLKETSVCILDQDGTRVFEGKVASEPAAIIRLVRKRAPDLTPVGLESGPTSVWLTHALKAEASRWCVSMPGMPRPCCRCGPTSPTVATRAGWLRWPVSA